MNATEEQLRKELRDSFKNRAILYYYMYDQLRHETNPQKAEALMRRVTYRRGEQIGKRFSQFSPEDFEGLREAFIGGIPDGGAMFAPQVTKCDEQGLDVQLEQCPLKEAWQELGLSEDDLETMCRIAGEIDAGTFEGAGFAFEPDTWKPGRSGCCHLHIRCKMQAGE